MKRTLKLCGSLLIGMVVGMVFARERQSVQRQGQMKAEAAQAAVRG